MALAEPRRPSLHSPLNTYGGPHELRQALGGTAKTQSKQSEPRSHVARIAPGRPSSHSPLNAVRQVSRQSFGTSLVSSRVAVQVPTTVLSAAKVPATDVRPVSSNTPVSSQK